MAERSATHAYLHTLLGPAHQQGVTDAVTSLVHKLDAGDERDDEFITGVRTALADALGAVQARALVRGVTYPE